MHVCNDDTIYDSYLRHELHITIRRLRLPIIFIIFNYQEYKK